MTKYLALALFLTGSLLAWSPSTAAQGWEDADATSAGFSGAQKRQSHKTDPQAEWADQQYVDPEFLIPRATGTGELAHQSVNRRAIRSGGYSFGFGNPGPSFPNPYGLGIYELLSPQQQFGPPGTPQAPPVNPQTNPGLPSQFPGGQFPSGLYSGPNPNDLPNVF
jgi:hypothetical protein